MSATVPIQALVAAVEPVRRWLREDDGDVEVAEIVHSCVTLSLLGTCAVCPWAHLTLAPALEALILDWIPGVSEVRLVRDDVRTAAAPSLAPPARTPIEPGTPSSRPIVAASARMRELLAFARVVAEGDATVLVMGETGTGKEVLARVIHDASRRRARPFVPVSCALLSPALVESELFGHERGAFTGAVSSRPGRFEQAQGGTVFLDDVDDIPMALQVKLLRVLQERTIERLGGRRPVPVDVRVIAASKCDLRSAVTAGRFRQDLYHRLNVIPIAMPPLRWRRDDIPELARAFLARGSCARGAPARFLSPAVQRLFTVYRWPGNVRELENICERVTETCQCHPIRLPCVSSALSAAVRDASPPPAPVVTPPRQSLDDRLREVEAELLQGALQASHGNRSAAARLLKMSRSRLLDRMRRLGINDHDGASG